MTAQAQRAHRVAVRLLGGECPISARYVHDQVPQPGFQRLRYVVYCEHLECMRFICPDCGTRVSGPLNHNGKTWYRCWEHAR